VTAGVAPEIVPLAAAATSAGVNAREVLGDACGEEAPMGDAARAAAQAVPIGTRCSRRLFGEGCSRNSRMGEGGT
jgi:hypothetical protein